MNDAPIFRKTLVECVGGIEEAACFLRILGMALIGEVRQACFIVLTGKGRNGKTILMEIIGKILGPLSGAIRSEMLLDQRQVSNSSGPTPDIMSLKGLRVAIASETGDSARISPSRVKWLTGNDTITGRNPHDRQETRFQPSHTLFLLTNHKPQAQADEFAFWERMVLFPFELSFVDREPRDDSERRADHGLKEKLEEEMPAILAMLVRGCIEYQQVGLCIPPSIRAATQEYQSDMDVIGDFITECCVLGDDLSIVSIKIYDAFETWWTKNVSSKAPSHRRFGEILSRRFKKKKSRSVTYFGLALAADENIFNERR